MRTKIFNLFIVTFVILSLFSGMVQPVFAQGLTNPNEVSLAQINATEIQLIGPYDSSTLTFGLPANWNLSAGAKLNLNLAVSFSVIAAQAADGVAPVVQGGNLTVRFNGVSVAVLTLNQLGEVSKAIDLPAASLISQRADGRMELGFILDSGISCTVNQQMSVFIHTNSVFTLPHDEIEPDTSLVNFPRPLSQDSVFSETVLVVIPDQPSSAELKAALTISAGLGSLAGTGLNMDLSTIGKLTPEQQSVSQLILVGKAASLPLLKELKLPFTADGGQFTLDAGAEDNGIVQEVSSPWSKGKVVLVVSGNTDNGVVKAAQAVSTGVLRPNTSPNLSIVKEVQPDVVLTSTVVDQTLNDLALAANKIAAAPGKAIKTLRFGSTANASYQFYLPPGQTVTPEAYFDLVYGNSTLLNYARSGLAILVNGQPIGTVRMNDITAGKTNNHAQFSIPSTVVVPGYNKIEIRSNLIPNDACTNPQFDGLWVTIWPDSSLHLPLMLNQIAATSVIDLSAYPAPFVLQSTLNSTAFVLPHDDIDSWRSALRIVNFMGNRTQGGLFTLAAFYGDEVKDPDRANYNFVMIGRASQLPVVTEFNANLPAPFEPNSDVAMESNLQVKFDIPATAPTGYVQLVASPWNPDNVILLALGNSTQGSSWAASSLVDAPLRTQLAGNFAAINGTQVVATDTRLISFVPSNVVQGVTNNTSTGGKIALDSPVASRPGYILPAIYALVALIVLLLLGVILGAWNRARKS